MPSFKIITVNSDVYCPVYFLKIFLNKFLNLFIFRYRGKEREREGEKLRHVRGTSISCFLHASQWGQAHNPGMCPDQESNQQPFALWDDAQPTQPHQSGLNYYLLI